MSRLTDLVDVIRGMAPDGIDSYSSEAPSDATLPWLVMNITLPDSVRAESGQHLAGTGSLLVTIATLTEDSTIFWVGKAFDAWRNQRPFTEGWSIGTLAQSGLVTISPDTVTVTETNLRVSVAKIRFTFTCSQLA